EVMSSLHQPDERHLLQPPQPWTGFENPQWMPPPPYESATPSAPPFTLPDYYDQVPGDVQPTPQQLQRPLVVPSPVVVNTSPSVHVVGVPLLSSRLPTGCCCLSNEKSAMFILYVLLLSSSIAVVSSFCLFAKGISSEFTDEDIIALTFTLPSAILFPGSISALKGVFNGQTAGLGFLLTTLNVYWFLVFFAAICTFCVLAFCGFLALFLLLAPISIIFSFVLFICILFQFAFLCAVAEIHKVLVDFRRSINRRRSAGQP
ncbi:hypothetical protein PMAYCL1PPCAC_02384, partial [Pristionchus mayeri]